MKMYQTIRGGYSYMRFFYIYYRSKDRKYRKYEDFIFNFIYRDIFDIIREVEKEDVIRELRKKKPFQKKKEYFFEKENEKETGRRTVL